MEGAAHEVLVVADSPDDLSRLKRALAAAVGALPGRKEVAILDWMELAPGLLASIRVDMAFWFVFYVILVVVIAFTILNTFLMAVFERTREFGVVMALGGTPPPPDRPALPGVGHPCAAGQLRRHPPRRAGHRLVPRAHGLFFNPSDLFGSFRPEDLEREYKTGEDMLYARLSPPGPVGLEAAYVPRRDPARGSVEWWDRCTLAARLQASLGGVEWDAAGAVHYRDPVVMLGSEAALGGSVWRVDAVWTHPHDGSAPAGFLSLVANADRSWTWWGRNFYGALELFGTTLGYTGYAQALADPGIAERFARGDLHTPGRVYAAGQLRAELHPLLQVSLAALVNLADPSGLLLPRLEWEAAPSAKLFLEASLAFGRTGTEFGGFEVNGTGFRHKVPDRVSARLAFYF